MYWRVGPVRPLKWTWKASPYDWIIRLNQFCTILQYVGGKLKLYSKRLILTFDWIKVCLLLLGQTNDSKVKQHDQYIEVWTVRVSPRLLWSSRWGFMMTDQGPDVPSGSRLFLSSLRLRDLLCLAHHLRRKKTSPRQSHDSDIMTQN